MDLSDLHPELSANVVSFARLLRAEGLPVGPNEQRDALHALEHIDLARLDDFRHALRLTLTKSPQEQALFDSLFPGFWTDLLTRNLREPEVTARPAEGSLKKPPATPQNGPISIKDWLSGNTNGDATETIAYSPHEVLSRKDFSHLRPDQLEEITRLIMLLARPLAVRHNRRYQRTAKVRKLDIRRSIRRNLRRGGEILDLVYRQRRKERLELVMLCDVSQSMDLYTLFLIQFIYAFQHVYRQIETFVFSTSLHRITSVLKGGVLKDVLAELPERVPDWGGGTKIGQSLQTFLAAHGGLVHSRTVVLILSDGWDTGELDVLAEGMRTLHRRANRVIWLNPLMGNPDFQPTAGGMEAALPYIDLLASAHNVESLRQTVRHLVRLQR